MTSASKNGRRGLVAAAGLSVAALALAGCSAGADSGSSTADSITVGTTDKVTTLDPAGSYDNGSLAVQTQVFPYLLNTDYQSTDVVPDLAESAEFTSPTEYTVTLPEGLKWANGNDLTSSDVKFSFDRNLAIADPNGASSLLYNLDSVETPDETTVVFHLKAENDQVFPLILTSFPGADRRRRGLRRRRADPRRRHRRRRTRSPARTSSRATTSTTSSRSRRTPTTRACSPRRRPRRST